MTLRFTNVGANNKNDKPKGWLLRDYFNLQGAGLPQTI